MNKNSNIFILLIIKFSLFSFLYSSEIWELKINHITTSYIGKKGILILKAIGSKQNINHLFKENELKEVFKTPIYTKNNDNSFDINCGFLNGLNSELFIFCEIEENISAGEYTIQINQKFEYLNTRINISQDNKISIIKNDYYIPFLYSSRQTLEINDNIDLYSLTFNIFSYNNEPLALSTGGNLLSLEKCENKNKKLICYLEKNEILSIMEDKEAWFKLEYISNKQYQAEFNFVDYINIKYITNKKKTNIRVNIIKLLVNCSENYRYIAYETDITNIPIISTDIYGFYLDFENSSGCEYFRRKCHFVKYEIGPLLILCKMERGNGEYRLREIEKEIDTEYLNVNYNFIIQPVNNTETFILSNIKVESYGIINYNKILDFRNKETLEIIYYMKNPMETKNIRLSNDSKTDLYCEDNNKVKICKIYKNILKENGYYYTSYLNHCGQRNILYEFSPLKIIVK